MFIKEISGESRAITHEQSGGAAATELEQQKTIALMFLQEERSSQGVRKIPLSFSGIAHTLPEYYDLNDLELATPARKEYVSNTRLYVVYNMGIHKEWYQNWLFEISNKKRIRVKELFIHYEEDSLRTQRWKTHMLIAWEKTFRSKSPMILDYNGDHPDIRYIKNTYQLGRVLDYLATLPSA